MNHQIMLSHKETKIIKKTVGTDYTTNQSQQYYTGFTKLHKYTELQHCIKKGYNAFIQFHNIYNHIHYYNINKLNKLFDLLIKYLLHEIEEKKRIILAKKLLNQKPFSNLSQDNIVACAKHYFIMECWQNSKRVKEITKLLVDFNQK